MPTRVRGTANKIMRMNRVHTPDMNITCGLSLKTIDSSNANAEQQGQLMQTYDLALPKDKRCQITANPLSLIA